MKLITISGPPSSGKTSVILRLIHQLSSDNVKIGVLKFDCLSTYDDELYRKVNVPIKVGLSGNLCPDHFFVTNIEDCVSWGFSQNLDLLISESAGLCNRCSPHIREVPSICIIDNLCGLNTPKKIGPMLKFADIVVITKGDIVSQAEREVFAFKVRESNPKAKILFVNGITGQGIFSLCKYINSENSLEKILNKHLKFTMPSAVCSYCLGETRIGSDYQSGYVKKIPI